MDSIVLGLGFGDEGKGLVTDWLTSKAKDPIVVRFSGGHQAGHTVVKDGVRHVFASFGSGTLRGAPTYWSKFCTVEPDAILNELKILKEKGVDPLLYIDGKAPITTPWEIERNRMSVDDKAHGSVGVGVSATIAREEAHYHLLAEDLLYPRIAEEKLHQILHHYYKEDANLYEFMLRCRELVLRSNIQIVSGVLEPLRGYGDQIYEGSQGLLLDQNFGFFPHVTRSNTGTKNALELGMKEIFDVYLVTRAYQTRHGAGPMTQEDSRYILDNPDETNKEHTYQGKFRKGLLDVELLKYGIMKDQCLYGRRDMNLVITCMDHLRNYWYMRGDTPVIHKNEKDFALGIGTYLGIPVNKIYINDSSESKTIRSVL